MEQRSESKQWMWGDDMMREFLKIKVEKIKIGYNGGQIVSIRNGRLQKNSARVIKEGRISTACGVGNINKDNLLNQALEKSEYGIPCACQFPKEMVYKEDLAEAASIDTSKSVERLKEVLEQINQRFPNCIHNGRWVEQVVSIALENSLGSELFSRFKLTSISNIYKHQDSMNMLDGWMSTASFKDLNPMEMIHSHSPYLEKYETEAPLKAGKYPFIFIDNGLIEHKITESISAENYFNQSSLFSDSLGKKIFHQDLSLIDINNNLSKIVYSPFDMEGFLRKEAALPIISEGKFVNLMADLGAAHKYDINPTGNGYREYNSGVNVRANLLDIKPGSKKLKELLKDIPEVIVCFLASGGDFLPNGDFSTPVQVAYLIQNGEVCGRLPQFQISSNIFNYLGGDLIAIAQDEYQPGYSPYLISQVNVLLQ